MGLDMYLLQQRNNGKKADGVLGCMNGMFPLGIKTDKEQIGYWRKAYKVNDTIIEELNVNFEDINCEDLELSLENCQNILVSIKGDLEIKNYCNEWEKDDLEQSIQIFENAINLIETENCKIFYKVWY